MKTAILWIQFVLMQVICFAAMVVGWFLLVPLAALRCWRWE
jgi:hypothetical protein